MNFISISLIFRVIRFIGRFARYFSKVTNWVRGVVAYKRFIQGIRFCVKLLAGGAVVREILKSYFKEGSQWKETTNTIDVPPNKVPTEIRERAEYSNTADITNEYEYSLQV